MLPLKGDVRRARLRLMRLATTPGGPFDPPLLSVSGRHLRHIDAQDRPRVVCLTGAREELWVRGEGVLFRATLDAAGKLLLRVSRAGQADVQKRLVRIPLGRRGTDGASRYYGRWEYGQDAAVLSPKGAGVILHPDSVTVDVAPELVDVYEAEGVRLALRNVPNGARVVCAEGIDDLDVDALVSDIRVPDIERGPDVEVHPREAFLRGFERIGLRANFAGIDFAGFAVTQGDGAPDLARFTKRQGGASYGAVRPIEPAEDEDALLEATLDAELKPSPLTGRMHKGAAGTINLTDGRRYRVRAGVRERLPSGALELVACALLDGALRVTVCVPYHELCAPDANVVLAKLKGFLLGLHVVRAENGTYAPSI